MKMRTEYIIIWIGIVLAFVVGIYQEIPDYYPFKLDEEPEQNLTGTAFFGNTSNDFGNKIHIDCKYLSENPNKDLIVNQSKASELCRGFFPSLNWSSRNQLESNETLILDTDAEFDIYCDNSYMKLYGCKEPKKISGMVCEGFYCAFNNSVYIEGYGTCYKEGEDVYCPV